MMPFEDLHQAREVEQRAAEWGFRRRRTLIPEGSRTAFRDNPEHHRSVATLATRLCGKGFGFVKRNLSGAKRRNGAASGERGAGKGAAALVPASAHSGPGARIALQTLVVHCRIADDPLEAWRGHFER